MLRDVCVGCQMAGIADGNSKMREDISLCVRLAPLQTKTGQTRREARARRTLLENFVLNQRRVDEDLTKSICRGRRQEEKGTWYERCKMPAWVPKTVWSIWQTLGTMIISKG